MIYRQRNKNKFKGYKIIFIIFITLFIFRIFNGHFFINIFNSPINYILESHSIVLSPFKHTLLYFKSKNDLEAEVEQLKKENGDLKLENLLSKTISQEFEYFYSEFGTTTIGDLYKVILKPPFTPFDTMQISGNLSQKQDGAFVYYKSVLIGKLIEHNNSYGTVELFSSPEKVTPVVINGTQFEAKGLGAGRFILECSKEFEVEIGDSILYPDQKIRILGVVEYIEKKEEDLFKKVYFNLPVTIDSISYITIES